MKYAVQFWAQVHKKDISKLESVEKVNLESQRQKKRENPRKTSDLFQGHICILLFFNSLI